MFKNTVKELKEKSKGEVSSRSNEVMCELLLKPIQAVFDIKAIKLYPLTLNVLRKL